MTPPLRPPLRQSSGPAPTGAGQITVVGLGPGPLEQLSLGALQALRAADVVYARTLRHPTVELLQTTEGLALVGPLHWLGCDDIYERAPSFVAVYGDIVDRLLAGARDSGRLIYAVPGHPLVAEQSVQMLLPRAAEAGLRVAIVGSQSCVEAVCEAVGADAATGLQVADALALDYELSQPGFPSPWAPVLLLQVYSRHVASDAKLALLRYYPPQHMVHMVYDAGLATQRVETCPLSEIDRHDRPDHLCSLWVPPLEGLQPRSSLRTMEAIIARLRAPDGCPWDREQTHDTIKRNLLEETYELLEALDAGDPAAQTEELGDLLMQVFLHAQIGREAGEYDLGDVTAGITDKLVRRHPHVFGDLVVADAEEVLRNWDVIKKAEGKGKQSVLEGLPPALAALTMALAITRRAATSGFTWPAVGDAWAKFEEELQEFRTAGTDRERRYELGDVLFALVNVGRMLGYDAEECLRAANRRFRERFMAMEHRAAEQGMPLGEQPLDTLLALWKTASGSAQR